MKIMICEGCGRFLHRDGRCLHCGGTGMYPAEYDKKLHHAAAAAYAEMDRCLAARKFDRVKELSGQVLEWMGACSDVYWMRLLASAGCATDRELLRTGADLDASADYHNALKYAESEEHQVYLDVRDKLESVKGELMAEAQTHCAARKREMDLPGTLKALDNQTENARRAMMELWRGLAELDDEIRALDEQCRSASQIHRSALEQAQSRAAELKKTADAKKECSEAEFLAMQGELAAVMQLSEEAAAELAALEQDHPWLERYQELLERQEALLAELEEQKDALGEATHRAEERIQQMERCLREEQAIYRAIRAGEFAQAGKGLPEGALARALSRAGVM